MSVRAPQTVPKSEVLTVVEIEIEVVVHVMGRPVDHLDQRPGDTEVSVVYGDGPDVDEHKQDKVHHLVVSQ